MKKLFIMSLLAFVLVVSGSTNVMGWCDDNRYNYNNPSANAEASANVGDVSGGNATADVDNTNTNTIEEGAIHNDVEGGNATIEKGAVNNTNEQEQDQLQGQMQGQLQGQKQNQDQDQDQNQSQSINEGAVQNDNSQSQTSTSNESNSGNSNQSQSIEKGAVQSSNNSEVNNSGNSESSSSASADNSGNSNVSINYEDERELPNAQAPHSTPQASPFTAKPGEMHQFFSMKKLFDVKKTWTKAELTGLVHKSDGAIRDSRQIAYTSKDREPNEITVVYDKPEGKMLGIIKVWLEDNDGDSIKVIGNAMNFALNEMKGSKIMPVNEGARKVLASFSWSIGLTWSTMHVSSDSGGAGSGGTGISGANLGYEAEPFVRFFVFE